MHDEIRKHEEDLKENIVKMFLITDKESQYCAREKERSKKYGYSISMNYRYAEERPQKCAPDHALGINLREPE